MSSHTSSLAASAIPGAPVPGKSKKNMTKTPVKRFSTRAEEFCAFITSLGYQIPKYTKSEHYDYIFQDDETAKIARQMMKEIQPKNILELEEIQKFNKLRSEGRVLYGVDLEEALERRKSREIQRARMDQAYINKDEELDRLIAEKHEQIRQIKSIDSVLSEAILQRDTDKMIVNTKEESQKSYSELMDREIQVKEQEIIKLTDALQTKLKLIHSNISSGCEIEKPIRLCDMDWLKMLQAEDKLNLEVKFMFEKYGAELIRQEIGGSDLRDPFANPLDTEGMYRMFSQHEKHLERLKHVIIHEKIREIDLDIEMAGSKSVLSNMNKIIKEAELLSQADPGIQDRMLRDVQQTNESFEVIFEREKSDLLNTERQDETTRLNIEVKEIVDMRSRAKKKLHEFYAFLINILVHQRVRVDLVRELIRAERTKNEHFAWKLQDYRNSLLIIANKEDSVQSDLMGTQNIEPELLAAFQKHKIPPSFYRNPINFYQALLAVQFYSNLEKEACARKEDEEYKLKKKKMFQQIDHLQTLTQNLKNQTAAKTPMEKVMSELEQVHRDMQNKLEFHKVQKERLAQESISKKLNLVKDVWEMLAQHKESKEQSKTSGEDTLDEGASGFFPITDH